jgi:hypothetical protein
MLSIINTVLRQSVVFPFGGPNCRASRGNGSRAPATCIRKNPLLKKRTLDGGADALPSQTYLVDSQLNLLLKQREIASVSCCARCEKGRTGVSAAAYLKKRRRSLGNAFAHDRMVLVESRAGAIGARRRAPGVDPTFNIGLRPRPRESARLSSRTERWTRRIFRTARLRARGERDLRRPSSVRLQRNAPLRQSRHAAQSMRSSARLPGWLPPSLRLQRPPQRPIV